MEQLRQVGEAIGGVNALMAFHDDLRCINPRQCALLAHAYALAFRAVAGELRARLRFHDRLTKWKPLDDPLRELHRVVRDGEAYIRHCLLLDPAHWWARAAAATHGTECVEHHLHNLLWCVSVVVEAVENVGEVTGSDPDELARRRLALARDYDKDLLDPKLFRERLGETFLATRELAARMDMAWKEDRWLLSQLLDERKGPTSSPEPPLTRQEHRLADLLAAPRGKLHPASVLLMSDFHMRRRLGGNGNLKEVQWLGEAFAVKHVVGVDAEAAAAEVAALASVSPHPNVAHCRYCFHDEEKRELYMVMDQLMSKDLGSYVKEVNSAKRRAPLPLVVVVDTMLQIACGMAHLHSNKMYHGNLNPSNVLVKPRHGDAYLHVKVAGFVSGSGTTNAANPCIWCAPEVVGNEAAATEKGDVYSFGMICFELITGKIPFEDNHLQGENMSKNIRAGERPLFPFQSPKYLTSLTRRCWHGEAAQRPPFHSICRVLRYVKRFLVMNNPEQAAADAAGAGPAVDYLDMEAQLLRRFPEWEGNGVADVPFEMYAYRVMERDKMSNACRDRSSDSGSDGNSLWGDDSASGGSSTTATDASASSRPLLDRSGSTRSSPPPPRRKVAIAAAKAGKCRSGIVTRLKPSSKITASSMSVTCAGPPQKSRSMGTVRPPPVVARRTPRIKSDGHLNRAAIPPTRRRKSGGNASDSELA
uniref:Protein kinase domain-containing protein n=1 Tax=Oryza nivara TaxID=4536 RepID=A0A0E0GTD0_ORYNI